MRRTGGLGLGAGLASFVLCLGCGAGAAWRGRAAFFAPALGLIEPVLSGPAGVAAEGVAAGAATGTGVVAATGPALGGSGVAAAVDAAGGNASGVVAPAAGTAVPSGLFARFRCALRAEARRSG